MYILLQLVATGNFHASNRLDGCDWTGAVRLANLQLKGGTCPVSNGQERMTACGIKLDSIKASKEEECDNPDVLVVQNVIGGHGCARE